jgi:peroxiredoxin
MSAASRQGGTMSEQTLGEGDLAPDFTLPQTDGSEVELSDLRGKNVVL